MKNIFIIIFSLFLVISCNNKKRKSTSVNTNTLLNLDTVQRKKTKVDETDNCSIIFDEFFERFSKDSIFQKQRVKYPLKWSYYDESYEKLTIDYVMKKDFAYIDFSEDKNAMENESGKYKVFIEKKGKNKINYLLKGYDNGLYMKYIFELDERECWYLVEIIDEST